MLQPDKKTVIVHGHRMAYREIGEGDPIIFAHDNPHVVLPLMQRHATPGRARPATLIHPADSRNKQVRALYQSRRETTALPW
ncbi:MAG: hypothetical protein JO296_13140 [Pseudonocardiales bacterium]|nr:hypothetical protein [Pseudonocardiales bacterium]